MNKASLRWVPVWLIGAVALAGAQLASAQLPKRDLTIEIRQIEEGRDEGKSYGAGPANTAREWEPQMVQVRNGEKASLRINDAIPMQWVQSVSMEGGKGGKGAKGSGALASVNNALVWFDAGQSLTVRPQWGGGNKPAQIEIEVAKAAVSERVGADLPTQSRNTLSTTVTAPLAQWMTIAATGKLPQGGSYSSEAAHQVRRLLQVRVLVP